MTRLDRVLRAHLDHDRSLAARGSERQDVGSGPEGHGRRQGTRGSSERTEKACS